MLADLEPESWLLKESSTGGSISLSLKLAKHNGMIRPVEDSSDYCLLALHPRRRNTLNKRPLQPQVESQHGNGNDRQIRHNLTPLDIELEEVL